MDTKSIESEIRAAAEHVEAAASLAAARMAPRWHGLLAHIERHIYRINIRLNNLGR